MYLWAPTHDSYFDNNIANRNNSYPNWDEGDLDFVVADFAGATFRNNLNIGNQYVFGQSPYYGSVTVENDWYWEVDTSVGDGDPCLVDYDNGDYHPATGSPLIGYAQNLSQHYSTDFDGVTLPTSGPWDIGAYYIGSSCTATDCHVEAMVCSEQACGGANRNGVATVTIYDDCGYPVPGAEVTGTFTGSFNEQVMDTTDGNGVAVLVSTGCLKKPVFQVCIDDVVAFVPYDPNDNLVTCCND
jgi:hypothetical protein